MQAKGKLKFEVGCGLVWEVYCKYIKGDSKGGWKIKGEGQI